PAEADLLDASSPEDVFWAIPGVTAPPTGPSPLLTALTSALDAVVRHGPLSGSRADTTALFQLAERARALALRELAEMDAVAGHARPGQPTTTASWLRDQRHLTDGAARAAVHLATALRDDLPALGDLLAAGTITVEHASAVVAGVRGLDRDVVAEAQDGLCALAQVTDPVDLRKRLRDKAAAIDDRIAAEAERRARERMGLRLNDVGPHTSVDGTLAGDDGATVRLAMDLAIEAAREAGDQRGKAARQADVLVQWATDYLTRAHGPGDSVADDAHTVRTHLHVMCRPDQLPAPQHSEPISLGEWLGRDLAGEPPAAPSIAGDSGPLSRGALRRLACDAIIDLVVLQQDRGSDPLYIGRAARTVNGRLFRALVARDRHCVVKGCGRRPAQCAAHHVRHWADDGLTDLDNLVLLCHQHHHDHHDRKQDLPHRDGQRRLTQQGWAHSPP
ncbi:MAG: HNH endonuclease, partial [Frankiaceae bacterium]|nr:HNH endonuclease [Frankiaceae bacterium]